MLARSAGHKRRANDLLIKSVYFEDKSVRATLKIGRPNIVDDLNSSNSIYLKTIKDIGINTPIC